MGKVHTKANRKAICSISTKAFNAQRIENCDQVNEKLHQFEWGIESEVATQVTKNDMENEVAEHSKHNHAANGIDESVLDENDQTFTTTTADDQPNNLPTTVNSDVNQEFEEMKANYETLLKQHRQVSDKLANERRSATEKIQVLKRKHATAIVDMEKKMQRATAVAAAAEAQKSQLEAKYTDILKALKKKFDAERNRSTCVVCEQPIEQKRVCSEQCEKTR